VQLTWLPATDNLGVTGYRVSRGGVQIATTQQTQVVDSAAADGKLNSYAVRGFDAVGNVGPAVSASVTLPDVTAPSAPLLSATAGSSTSVQLKWTASTDNVGVTGYVVSRAGVAIASVGPGTTSYVDESLTLGRTYTYSVAARDAAGNVSTSLSATVALTTADVTPPSKPLGLVGQPLGRRRVSLTWQASTDDRQGTLRYQVFRGRRKIATVTETTYVDRPAKVGLYKYRVRAVDAAGNKSSFSAAIWVRAKRRV
jgi:fibronectin type 3 domain-containing protein